MLWTNALAMISQHLDDAAFRKFAMAASVDHYFQFGLKRVETGDAQLDISEASTRYRIRRTTGLRQIVLQREKRAYCGNFEPKFAAVTDKSQPPQITVIIAAPISIGTLWSWQKANLFIIPDGWHFHAARLSGFANRNIPHFIISYADARPFGQQRF